MQRFGLRDIFCQGVLTQTGVGSGLSPVGPFSAPHELFPSCNNSAMPGNGPFYDNPFSKLLQDQLKTWHSGKAGAETSVPVTRSIPSTAVTRFPSACPGPTAASLCPPP